MKIAGYLSLILGSVFELLFLATKLGGSAIPRTAFTIGAMLMVIGWRFITFSRAARKQAQCSTGAHTPATILLPVTPDIKVLLDGQIARTRRIVLSIAGGFFALSALGGLLSVAAIPGRDGSLLASVIALFGVLAAAMILTLWKLLGDRQTRRDRDSRQYLRTSGTVALATLRGGWLVRVGDQAFLANPGPAVNALRSLPSASVDHTLHSHVIFEVRDASGVPVYRLPGYRAAA